LLEEALLNGREALERGQFDHRQHLVFEEHGEDDQVDRHPLAETGADANVILRSLGDQDRLLLQGGLTDERLADLELVRDVLALLVAVGGDKPKLEVVSLSVGRLHHEERAVL